MQLEMLLLLHREPTRLWTAADIARELRIDSAWSGQQLQLLVARRLLAVVDAKTPSYRYESASSDAIAVDSLARAYADRRVRVIGMIYSKPAETLRNFADAFRFRRDDGRKDEHRRDDKNG